MKKFLLPLLLLALVLFIPSKPAEAQALFSLGGHFGIDMDQDATFLGAQARFGGAGIPVLIQPGVDFGLNENSQYIRAEGNALYFIGERFTTTFTPYVGPGVAFIFRDTDGGENDMDVGINAVGGVEFRPLGPGIVPYVQARYTFQPGTDPLGIMGGILFRFGGT